MRILELNLVYPLSLLLLLPFLGVAAADSPPYSCGASESYPFCNATLPISKRVGDLLSRLTLDEKISQLVNSALAIPRLGIPAYEWWSESLHGVSNSGLGIRFNGTIRSATSFPQVILTAASFDPNLWYRIGQVIGIEARAVYNSGQAQGLTFWAPNINIFRDPRWGRGQETPGEDPTVAGKYAVAYVRGVQGASFDGRKRLKGGRLQASACCKHFTAYDLDNWQGVNRFKFDAVVSPQDLADTYQPPFQSCIQKAGASGIMCAYNRVNGVPNCADYNLLTKTARGLWGFNGYITSDCDAVSIIREVQQYAKTPEDAVADVLKAGMDVNCGSYLQKHTKSAVEQKKVSENEIDRALYNLFSIRMRLGLFDGNPRKHMFGKIGPNQVCTQEHQALALEAARDGIVLLKNSHRALPLPNTTMSLAVIGPNANSAHTLLGNYAGPGCKSVTPLQALQNYVKDIKYHSGCDSVACSNASIQEAVEIAKNADQVLLFMGLDLTQEREEHDRTDLVLPGQQPSLISSIAQAAKKPVILVLICGGPVDVSFAHVDQKIGSILWAGYPGEAGGIALAEIIFGDYNPGGRLPMTWYPQEFIKVPMTDMRMRPDPTSGYPGRTHRFYTGKKVYEFGDGLSYSNYSYKFSSSNQNMLYLNLTMPDTAIEESSSTRYKLVSELKSVCNEKKIPLTIEVMNQGEMAGKHPLLLSVGQKKMRSGSPMKQLVAFQSISLSAGERAKVKFEVNPCEHLTRVMKDGLKVVDEGTHFFSVGDEEYPINIVI